MLHSWTFQILALCLVARLTITLPAAEPAHETTSPRTPRQALEGFALDARLQIELVASEPQVVDPVAMAFDEQERLWVVEMRDYPFGPENGQSPRSRVKLLEDLDADGYYETAHTFADELLFATGVQPWQGGVIVTLSGEIAWLADTDGDLQADVHQTWFRGFAERNPQLRANDPTLWFDGNVYVAGGLFYGGKITTEHPQRQGQGDDPLDLGRRDFRFDPRTGAATALAGGAQFGLAFDALGNRFVGSNNQPLLHVVIEEHYLTRNPLISITQTNHHVVSAGDATPVYPLSRQETTSYLHEGQFTAACGIQIYGGVALPEEFRGNAFICEPTGSLVHRAVIEESGVSFSAPVTGRAAEFLASQDPWFRPVFLTEGPDGALYLADMYRAVIEHPEWFPDLSQRTDLLEGSDRGRIWRITSRGGSSSPSGDGAQQRPASLGKLPAAELAKLLDHPNAWHRSTAARLIYERRERSDSEGIRKMRETASEQGRIAVLLVLHGLGELTIDDILSSLSDTSAAVRRITMRLAEPQIGDHDRLRQRVLEIGDSARPVSAEFLQAVLSLGSAPDQELSRLILSKASAGGSESEWIRSAMLCSLTRDQTWVVVQLSNELAHASERPTDGQLLLIQQLAEEIGFGGTDDQIRAVLSAGYRPDESSQDSPSARQPEWMRTRLLGISQGAQRRGVPFRQWIKGQDESWQDWWKEELQRAAFDAASEQATLATREQAIAVLELADFEGIAPHLQELVYHSESRAVRLAAIKALGRVDHPRAAKILLSGFADRIPMERQAILSSLLSRKHASELLLNELENGGVDSDWMDASTRERLLSHSDPEIRKRAQSLLAMDTADRDEILKSYRPAVVQAGDPTLGRIVFERHCATCHRVGGVGTAVGPDIADNYNKTREQLLTAILDPNRTVDSSFEAYVVLTKGGRTLQGLLETETASAITLKEAEGQTYTIARDEIEELRPTGVSFMPSGVERDIEVGAMTDLLTFLKEWRRLEATRPAQN